MFKKTFQIVKKILSILVVRDQTGYDYMAELERKAQAQKKPYLEEKSDYLDECSQSERENRVFLSRVINAQDMRLLRRKEELERKKANCRFSRERWKRLKNKKAKKELTLYLESQIQKRY